jgi:hypothetical protein
VLPLKEYYYTFRITRCKIRRERIKYEEFESVQSVALYAGVIG